MSDLHYVIACNECEPSVRKCRYCPEKIYFTQYRKPVNYVDGSLHRCRGFH